ncbi:MAG: cell surface protein, partial [Muribaculaceae bacterium]|nr:cell surface protein [Muribaculaceae bacterium]
MQISLLATLITVSSCSTDIPMVNLGIDDTYYIYRMQKLPLHPALTGEHYRWSMADGTLLSTSRDYIFLAADEGSYDLVFDIVDAETPYHFEFTINVLHEEVEYSPYIAHVYEYCPAPGQFINEMPRYEDGDTYSDMLQKAEESISGTNDIMISLGGYGGYVTFGFDHTVINSPGRPDFRIWGNAFYELLQPDKKGGSAEPGIVMVSYDINCNGLPDDPWYELAGSAHSLQSTISHYSITYRRPDPDRIIMPDNTGMYDDINYIAWSDSKGTHSHMPKNIFHTQPYYPQWISADSITFTGTLLPPNADDISGTGSYFILYSYDWGYVDNHPNDYADLNSFDIDNSIDATGLHVTLPGIDFIRVYTGVNQYCGWLGETSTELCR